MTKIVNSFPQTFTRAIFILLLSMLIDVSLRFVLETYGLISISTYSLPFSKESAALTNIGLSTLYLFFKVGFYIYPLYACYAWLENHKYFRQLYARILLFVVIQLGSYKMIEVFTGEKILLIELILITSISALLVPKASNSIMNQQQKINSSDNEGKDQEI